ncbi:hypothetical protein BCV69DRAFT_10347 [Microstroma glucosiphilum]|uniref:Uncharacterized protein n=1 Tax=Pseudomicrostroma glucosiphilum TaxID=1684307 RepID=A0A316UER1_9BASI|nr:hypothetical protein BCV69DRAFT_10347 [Pseudomicrostroma glucosiphilum]PWN23787.1 hypothetical protein BCV69DRAFT_10347 [Pseudomicrostroma glucosiphilum]
MPTAAHGAFGAPEVRLRRCLARANPRPPQAQLLAAMVCGQERPRLPCPDCDGPHFFQLHKHGQSSFFFDFLSIPYISTTLTTRLPLPLHTHSYHSHIPQLLAPTTTRTHNYSHYSLVLTSYLDLTSTINTVHVYIYSLTSRHNIDSPPLHTVVHLAGTDIDTTSHSSKAHRSKTLRNTN